MPTSSCPSTDCEEQVIRRDEVSTTALCNAHISTTDCGTGNGPNKSEKLFRSKANQGGPVESWDSLKGPWKMYKTGAGLSEAECGPHLTYCRNEELRIQPLLADPETATKPVTEQIKAIRSLAVIPDAVLNMSQKAGESARSFLARVQDKAAMCDFKTKCPEECCEQAKRVMDSTNTTARYALINGLGDAEICRKTLGRKALNKSSPLETVAFAEQMEMARDACKTETAVVKTTYREHQASTSPDETMLQREGECDECEVQMVRKQNTEDSQVRTSRTGRAQENEAATLFVSGNLLMACQGKGSAKVRRRARKHNYRTRRLNFKVPGSRSTQVAMMQLKVGAAVVLEHHIFDPMTGWTKRKPWEHPRLRLVVRPCEEMYSNLNARIPDAGPMVVDGIADTGAQACLWSARDFYRAGYKKQDLFEVKQRIAAANRQPLKIVGAAFLKVEANDLMTQLMAFITPDIHGLYLSRQVLTELYVIPRSFPTAGDAKIRADAEETGFTTVAIADRAPCGCLSRKEPPPKT